jgi:hypothetical protein
MAYANATGVATRLGRELTPEDTRWSIPGWPPRSS